MCKTFCAPESFFYGLCCKCINMLNRYVSSYNTVRFMGRFVSRFDGGSNLPFAILKAVTRTVTRTSAAWADRPWKRLYL